MRKKRVDPTVRRLVFDRSESDAMFCGCEVMIAETCAGLATDLHHRQMRSQGGEHTVHNSLACCRHCHLVGIHKDPKRAYENGWLVHGWDAPDQQPVLRRGRWVLLDEIGGFTAYNKENYDNEN